MRGIRSAQTDAVPRDTGSIVSMVTGGTRLCDDGRDRDRLGRRTGCPLGGRWSRTGPVFVRFATATTGTSGLRRSRPDLGNVAVFRAACPVIGSPGLDEHDLGETRSSPDHERETAAYDRRAAHHQVGRERE